MSSFGKQMENEQLSWRRRRLPSVQGKGAWHGKTYQKVLPRRHQQDNLWPGIQSGGKFPLDVYLTTNGIQPHTGRDHLLSSWTLCANLYFPFGQDPDGLKLVGEFLRQRVDSSIVAASAVELEYEHGAASLKPSTLLGELAGGRGSHQTSPDVAFVVEVKRGGTGVVLTEVKFTEHNFYPCSIRKTLPAAKRDSSCHNLAALKANPQGLCGQHTVKGRRYWDHLAGCFDWQAKLRRCPAATAGYQLFRQHALAEGLARDPGLALVVSSVAYDKRNDGLVKSLKSTGVPDVTTGWTPLFAGKAKFTTFTHQQWVEFVRTSPGRPAWCDGPDGWINYVSDRYGL